MPHVRSLFSVAAVTAATLLACASSEPLAGDAGLPPPTTEEASTGVTELHVRTALRDAWLDEAQWTHLYVTAALAKSPEAGPALARLNATETDIAVEVGAFVGDAKGNELAGLLRTRAADMVAWVSATNAGVPERVAAADSAWHDSAHDVASYFQALGPYSWNTLNIEKNLRGSVDDAQQVATARGSNDYTSETAAGDSAEKHGLATADLIVDGLLSAYKGMFVPNDMLATEETLHLTLRPMFQDRIFWTRLFVIEQMDQRPAQPLLDRAIQSGVDIANVFDGYVGDGVPGQVQLGLHNDLADTYTYIIAGDSGDATAIQNAKNLWYGDDANFAHELGSIGPSWNEAALQSYWRIHVDKTLAELDAHRAKQWDADAANYQLAVENARALSDVVATSIATGATASVH